MTRGLAGTPVPARGDLGRRGHELLAVLRARRGRRAVPVRRRRRGDPDRGHRPAGAQLALLSARRRSRAALRLPRQGPLRARRRSPLQPREAAASTPTRRRSRASSTGPTTPTCSPTCPTAPRTTTTSPTTRTTPAAVPKSIVVDTRFDWQGDVPPRIPFADTIIYETHVKGFTMRHPEVREDLRGTYAGLASEPAIAYLKDLGVTAVELLPVHHISDESFLYERGLSQLLGLQHDRLLRAALRVRRHRAPRRAGAASSREWSRRCTRPGSR